MSRSRRRPAMPTRRLDVLLRVAALVCALSALSLAKPTKWIHSFAGPYIVYIDWARNCDDEMIDKSLGYIYLYARMSHWNPMRPLDNQTVSGNISLVNYTGRDNTWIVLNLATRSNNMWKGNAIVVRSPGGACSFMRNNIPDAWRAMFPQYTDRTKPCEVPPGVYPYNNKPMHWGAPNFPVLPYGYYRATVTGGLHGRKQPNMCLVGEGHVVPKVSA